jgi:hypothetical protein
MGLIVWGVIFALVIAFAFAVTRWTSQEKEDGLHDTGLAILQFGRAFPSEAIRQLQKTTDGQAVFVRLHDNKAGFIRNNRNHFACHLIQPGRVRVTDSGTGRGLAIEFLDAPHHNGTFEFPTPMEVAEVSLWLLGNYVSDADLELPTPGSAANNG